VFVLGIDPGLSRCGFGAVRQVGARPEVVASGVITTPPGGDLPARLAQLAGELRELLRRTGPDVVVVERVLFQANARTAMSVGQASGLALVAAAERGVPVVQYSPNEVKQAVTGWGGAGKEQVQRMVQALLRLPEKPSPPDRADALALALCHLAVAPLVAAAERAAVALARPAPGSERPGAVLPAGAGPGPGRRLRLPASGRQPTGRAVAAEGRS
jgi:crossover junction endodeoxyribonuclease RuvC